MISRLASLAVSPCFAWLLSPRPGRRRGAGAAAGHARMAQRSISSDPSLVVLDIRSAIDGGGAGGLSAAHIPGSVHSDYDKARLARERNGVPFMLPSVPELEELIGDLGIDEDSHVVVVPAGVSSTDFGSAARVYWTLKVAGVPNVSILDGGVAAWKAAGLPLESRQRSAVAEDLHRDDRQQHDCAAPATSRRSSRAAAPRWSMRARRAFSPARRRRRPRSLWPHSRRAECRQRAASTTQRPTG